MSEGRYRLLRYQSLAAAAAVAALREAVFGTGGELGRIGHFVMAQGVDNVLLH